MKNENKKVVFDYDDTLWALNKKACELCKVDFDKIHDYRVELNEGLTEDEVNRLQYMYRSPELWKEVEYFNKATDIADLAKYNADVYISSFCLNQSVADIKRSFFSKDLHLPEDHIILLVPNGDEFVEKDTNAYIFIDDSPFNMSVSKAEHNLMLNAPWNIDIDLPNVERFNSFEEIYNRCIELLSE